MMNEIFFTDYINYLLTPAQREKHEQRVQYGISYSPRSTGQGQSNKKGVDYTQKAYESTLQGIRKKRGSGEISMYEARWCHKHRSYTYFTYTTDFLLFTLNIPWLPTTPLPPTVCSMLLRYIYAMQRYNECRRRKRKIGSKESEGERVWKMIAREVEAVVKSVTDKTVDRGVIGM